LILSALNVLYKDIGLASNFLIQLWFFATPVMYSFENAPPKVRMLLFLNPLTFIIENLKICLLEGRGITGWQFGLMSLLIALFFILSYKFFIVTERKFADVI
jgi:ABC-type polysaccharide/polyol phosphate export permease